MQSCGFICSFLLLASLPGIGSAKHAKLPVMFKNGITFSQEYCNRLQNECDKGICTKCCEQYGKGCDAFADMPDSPIQIAKSENELKKQIKQINAGFKGELGIKKLTRSVVLEDGTKVTLHKREDLEEIFHIKNILSNGDKMDTPFFGLDAILTVEQARSVLNHSKTEGLRRFKRNSMVVGRKTVHKWFKTIHYVFDEVAARDPRTVGTAKSVASYINQHSCLNMVYGLPANCADGGGVECPNNYIVIVGGYGEGCSSNVGMTGGAQGIHMGSGCDQFGAGFRQFVHALGASTVPGCETFAPQPVQVPACALTPSFCSMQYLNELYCSDTCGQLQNPCWNGGYLNPANCASCLCPPLYSGPSCQTPWGDGQTRSSPPPISAIDCAVSDWSSWATVGECSRTCGRPCDLQRTRDITQYPSRGGRACPELEQQSLWPLPECTPVDCQMTEWSSWTQCDRTCGLDCENRRSRTVTRQPEHGGKSCDDFELDDVRFEDMEDCPVPADCEVSEWSSWSSCSQTCGSDCQVERNREIVGQASYGGRACSTYNLREVETQVLQHCPIDCQMSEWSDWSHCIQTCGNCEVKRWRTVIRHAQFGGLECADGDDSMFGEGDGAQEELKTIPLPECIVPVDAQVSEWSDWSSCTQTCDYCTQSRTRSCLEEAVLTGRRCDTYLMFEQREQYIGDCPVPLDCMVSSWSSWSECSQTCGVCQRVRQRQIVSEAKNGGRQCSDHYYRLMESQSHNLGECPRIVNCEVSNWSEWSGCAATCGACSSSRSRFITRHPEHGGSPCPVEMVETISRQQKECPKDCILAEWSAWAGCDRTCGHCYEYREKTVLQKEENGGRPCGDFCVRDQRRVPLPSCRRMRRLNAARH